LVTTKGINVRKRFKALTTEGVDSNEVTYHLRDRFKASATAVRR
jgi:hypothetical protein